AAAIKFVRVSVLVPTGPLTLSLTVLVPGPYVCVTLVAVVFVIVPSPNCQNRFVMVPVEVSVKLTVRGASPFVGDALKAAEGATTPTPVRGLAEFPPSLLTSSAPLTLPAALGAK